VPLSWLPLVLRHFTENVTAYERIAEARSSCVPWTAIRRTECVGDP
jgi:hypothetical protein